MTLLQQVMDLQAVVTQLEQEVQHRTSQQNNTSEQQTALQKSVNDTKEWLVTELENCNARVKAVDN
jgi:hypothetical protein